MRELRVSIYNDSLVGLHSEVEVALGEWSRYYGEISNQMRRTDAAHERSVRIALKSSLRELALK